MRFTYLIGLMAAGSLLFTSCKKDDDGGGGGGNTTPSIASLNCAGATISGSALANVSFSGVAVVPYTGGNGAAYAAGTAIQSTGVTGLTATLNAGTLASGAGNLSLTISGTPTSAGTAAFALSFGGQNCSLTLSVASPNPIISKWYYDGRIDSAICCVSNFRNGTSGIYLLPDSNITRTFTPNTYYYDFKNDGTFAEYYLDGQNYSGNWTFGYSATTGADSLNADYGVDGIQEFRVNSMTATNLQMRDRGFYLLTGRGAIVNGGVNDTLVYRLTWNFKK